MNYIEQKLSNCIIIITIVLNLHTVDGLALLGKMPMKLRHAVVFSLTNVSTAVEGRHKPKQEAAMDLLVAVAPNWNSALQ